MKREYKEYIEREVISEGIRKYYYKNPPNSSYQEGFDRGLDKAQRVILDAPVADVVEVRHGRWEFGKDLSDSFGSINKNKYHLYCSECRNQAFNKSADNDCLRHGHTVLSVVRSKDGQGGGMRMKKKIRTINDITAADWEDIKRRREQGANLDQVGELYGITGGALARYARLAGVDIPRRTDYNPLPPIEDIQRLRTEGMKWADIAAKYHVSRDRLHSYAQEHGIDTRLVRKPTLTPVDWDDVRKQREAGKTWGDIAEPYGISGPTLQKRAGRRGNNIGPSRYDRLNAMLDPDWPGWEDVKQMREQGEKWTDIAEHIGVTTATLRRMMAHLALRAPAGDAHKYYDGASPYGKTLYSQTLCWSCANAVPDKSGKRGCSWSRDFKPVKGWDADETRLYSDKPTQSYHVRSCPEFVRG